MTEGLLGSESAAIIDFTETAYNLGLSRSEWLPRVLRDGARFMGDGLGIAGVACWRGEEPGEFAVEQVHVQSCPDDFIQDVMRAQAEVSQEFLWKASRPTYPKTMSDAAAGDASFRDLMSHFDYAEDGLGLSAFDPDGHGVYLIAPLRARTSLTRRARQRLQMVASHFAAGNRLRRALDSTDTTTSPGGALPLQAEAVLDAKNFRIADAAGEAATRDSVEGLRDAAKRIDQARGRLRETEPEAALALWSALVRGRWSMVDWFDSDTRRFILAVPNAPKVNDPRGLTKKEARVVSYIVSGHTNKLIGYQLGLSNTRVSALVHSSMRKLGVRTRAQLIKKWRDFTGPSAA